jgi:hypothetical protein
MTGGSRWWPVPEPSAHASGSTDSGSATSIVDLLDRVVHRGAVISGDVVISLANVDLVRLDLRLLLIGIDDAVSASLPARTGRAS